jgi:hypothetical protein
MTITEEEFKEYFIHSGSLERIFILNTHFSNFNKGDVFIKDGNKLVVMSTTMGEGFAHAGLDDRRTITIESETDSVKRLLKEYD